MLSCGACYFIVRGMFFITIIVLQWKDYKSLENFNIINKTQQFILPKIVS